jgi:Leucine-rich repeat (LRR) protein
MKVLLADQRDRDRRRFVEEAQINGQLEHPNIVPVHELGVDAENRLYFTMKLVRGRTLADIIDLLARDPAQVAEFSRFRLLRVFIQVCNAVAFAHNRGVVHRDLKPSNIMIGDFGEVQVADWGLARVLPPERRTVYTDQGRTTPATIRAEPARTSSDDRLQAVVASFRRTPDGSRAGETVQGTIEGTPAYMPPEQAKGELDHIDERSDIYSLGAILYELLTLHPPVGGRTVDEVLDNVVNHRIPPPGARAPDRDIAMELSAICLKALSAEREHRYQRVVDLRRDVEAHLEHRAVSAHEGSAVEMLVKMLRRNRGAAFTGLVAMAVLVVVLAVSFGAIRKERDRALIERRNANDQAARLEQERQQRENDQRRAVPALLAKARYEVGQRNWQTALDDVQLALLYQPDHADCHLLRAQLAARARNFVAALRDLEIYRGQNPDDEDARRLAQLCAQASEDPSSVLMTAIADVLVRQGVGPIAEDLFAGGQERILVYRKQLELAWPGCTASGFHADKNGLLTIGGLAGRADLVDLTPLSGLPVARLRLGRTSVRDLSPLKGMSLVELDIGRTQVRDLSPLSGMPLTVLLAGHTAIDDLSPLSGMPLDELDITNAQVTTLAPLTGMPLRVLRATRTRVADLSPLTGMPLTALELYETPISDLTPLAGSRLTSLGLSAASRLVDLAPLKGLPLVRLDLERTGITSIEALAGMPLRQLNIRQTAVSDLAPLSGMNLTELDLSGLPVSSLAPLSGMPLTALVLNGTQVSALDPLRRMRLASLSLADTRLADLKPLKGLPLASLDLSRTLVTDLGPLVGMPLASLALDGTAVADLAQLKGMPLKELRLSGTKVSDLRPVLGCPLERLVLPPQVVQGLPELRQLATLKQLGNAWTGSWWQVPAAAEYWKKNAK